MDMQELNFDTNFDTKFDHIYIDPQSQDSTVAQRVRALFAPEKIHVVEKPPMGVQAPQMSAAEFARSKRTLWLTPFKGEFFKRCPGSRPGLSCCNYFVLNWGLQCDMNCSYCYLQSFLNTPVLTIYTNLEKALAELTALAPTMAQQKLRVGTGETVDSLSLDPITLFSRDLITFFRDYPNWTLEFKTKSAQVAQFIETPHAGNVIVSWSVNPQTIVEREEHGTASLSERLQAARLCREKGFSIAFHIDPMIWHPEWQSSYATLVDLICNEFTPEDVPYMSVGALRFQPEQRALMRERFGLKSLVTQAEVFTSRDGKMRYDAQLRQEMFQFVLNRFRQNSENWRLFMCMETPETWIQTRGQSPFKDSSLNDLFDPAVLVAENRARA